MSLEEMHCMWPCCFHIQLRMGIMDVEKGNLQALVFYYVQPQREEMLL